MTSHDEIDALLADAARLAGDYLRANADRDVLVSKPLAPKELQRRLGLQIPSSGRPLPSLLDDVRGILEHSVRTGHPRFLNQLFGGFDAAAILGEWITALVNTSMYTYESAPVATLLEMELIERMLTAVGFERGEGVFAPGGSISNLMCALAARHRAYPEAKQDGLGDGDRPVMFISEEAHYSMRRAACVMGLGTRAAIEIPTDGVGRMDPVELDRAIQRARSEGDQPFLVAATSGTTVPGAFDPLNAIADVAQEHGLWMHVDASYGGSILLAKRHRHLMAGVERADSVTWNPHKMMGVPLSCSATLMRHRGDLLATNGMAADYLFHDEGGPSIDLGDLTLQCGRRVDSIKLWLSWQALGDEGYERRVERLFEQAGDFRRAIEARPGFRLIREPEGPNVCFRYLPPEDRDLTGIDRVVREGETTREIRARLMERGRFMVNYATLDGAATFRIVFGNPRTTEEDVEALLREIEELGAGKLSAAPPASMVDGLGKA